MTGKRKSEQTDEAAVCKEGFDPRTPNQLEWEVILAEVAKRIEPSAGAAKKKKAAQTDSTVSETNKSGG